MSLIKPKSQTVQLSSARDDSSYMAAPWLIVIPKLHNGNPKHVSQSADFLGRLNVTLEYQMSLFQGHIQYDLWERGRLQMIMKAKADIIGSQLTDDKY